MEILNDFSTSVAKALSEIDPKWRDYKGLIVCGTHSPHDVEHMIDQIEKARKEKIPALLICFGYQLAAIEYARNVLDIKDATSEEYGQGTFIVKKRPELKVGLHDGESWWSNYEVDPSFELNWAIPDHFEAVPYHPEYGSSLDKPHPVLVDFINVCKKHV